MELQKQVVSLELAKKLKNLGVEQESLFEYRKFDNGKEFYWSLPMLVGTIPKKMGIADVGFGCVSAFTVAELGEMLPKKIIRKNWKEKENKTNQYDIMFSFDNIINDNFQVWYQNTLSKIRMDTTYCANTEANARAKMLIYLLENKLI